MKSSYKRKKTIPKNETKSINGIKYEIRNENDCIQLQLLNNNQWNKIIFHKILTYIKEKKLKHFLNIGCHIGTVCLPISLHVNKVTAIEAYPPTFDHLQCNINLNNLKNIDTHNIAVGHKNETIFFMDKYKICKIEKINRIKNNSGGMHVFTQKDIDENVRSANLHTKSIKNTMKKLDDLDINNFDIMLVDIEGFEYNFLLGAKNKIMKYKPIIIIEIWSDSKRRKENMKTMQNEIINLIKSMNYNIVENYGDDFIFEPIDLKMSTI